MTAIARLPNPFGAEPHAYSRRLKVLVIGEEIPYPPDAGKRIRTWNLLRRLATRHSLSYLCYGLSNDPAVDALELAGIHVHTVKPLRKLRGWPLYIRLFANLFSFYPYSVVKHSSKGFDQELRTLLNKCAFDLVHYEGTHCARYLSSVGSLPRVLGTHNIESQIWSRRARFGRTRVEQVFFGSQAIKMRSFERRALLRSEYAIAVTLQDARQMFDWGVPNVALVPNGVELEAYQTDFNAVRSCELLFLGALDWYPNIDALQHFINEILPLILSVQPNAVLRVVGRRPPESLRDIVAGNRNVEIVGEVKDVRPYLRSAGVVVVPLRIGGGSRIKILEALAAAKAVVSTSVGAEGLELKAGEHIQLADTSSRFAEITAALMDDQRERSRLGNNGRRFVSERYSWDSIAIKLESVWSSLAG